jgi:hypothetical protein
VIPRVPELSQLLRDLRRIIEHETPDVPEPEPAIGRAVHRSVIRRHVIQIVLPRADVLGRDLGHVRDIE